MAEFTTNYGMNKPDFNESIRHDEVNDNFDLLDAILFTITGISNFVGAWSNSTVYTAGQRVFDSDESSLWACQVNHTSAAEESFEADRIANPSFWTVLSSLPINKGAWGNSEAYAAGDIVYDASEALFGQASASHTSPALGSMRDDIANWNIIFDGDTIADALNDAEAALEAAISQTIRTVTDSTTLVLGDAFNVVEGNKATVMDITIPPNASVAFVSGTAITIAQYGAGQVTIVAGAGVTIRSRYGLKISGQYGMAILLKRGENEWYLSGDTVS